MNHKQINTYLEWARLFILICLGSVGGIAISGAIGLSWLTSYFVFTGVGAAMILLAIGLLIGLQAVDLPDKHL